jgi:hypothetical protein
MGIKRIGGVTTAILTALVFGEASWAWAHGVIGQRFFPATLVIDDPFVADELSMPTVSFMGFNGTSDQPAFRLTNISGEFSKRITPDLGFSINGSLSVLDPDHGKTQSGFDNMEVVLKYVFFKSAQYETLLSAGVSWEVGGTGSKRVGADSFDTVTPEFFFGQGMGALPDSVSFLKPFALTGVLGLSLPTRRYNKTYTTGDSGDASDSGDTADSGAVTVEKELNPKVFQWGFSIQYNLQYLQSYVRDVGLTAPFNRMIPLVEIALSTPVEGTQAGQTTGTVNPGVIWFGRYFQIGVEAQIPINKASGRGVGAIAQLHFYLDDIAPNTFTWTPFHGILGPTQPQ